MKWSKHDAVLLSNSNVPCGISFQFPWREKMVRRGYLLLTGI